MSTDPLDAERLLTFEEAARIAGCTTEALRLRVRRFQIPVQRPIPRRVYVRLGDLLGHLKGQSIR